MTPVEDRYAIAINKFLASNSELQIKLDKLNPVVAENLGITFEEYRQKELAKAFHSYAKSNGQDTSKLIIDLCATNEQDKREMYIQHYKQIADDIGMDFTEYCTLNRIEAK